MLKHSVVVSCTYEKARCKAVQEITFEVGTAYPTKPTVPNSVTFAFSTDRTTFARWLRLFVLLSVFPRWLLACSIAVAASESTTCDELQFSDQSVQLLTQTQGTMCLQQANSIPAGEMLGESVAAKDFGDCCDICRKRYAHNGHDGCNTFAFCGNNAGCWHPLYQRQYTFGDCLMYYQQELQIGGGVLSTRAFDVLEVVEFVTGVPVHFEPTHSKDYKMYAYGLLEDLADFSCNDTSYPGKCQFVGVTEEEVEDLCSDLSDICYGYEMLPEGNLTTNVSIATLKGGTAFYGFTQYLLYINNYMVPAPSAGLYVRKQQLPSANDFEFTFWLTPAVMFENQLNKGSGCIIEYNTLYHGRTVTTLTNMTSAVQCCKACEQSPYCNSYVFCPYPHGCSDRHAIGDSMPLGTCLLQDQVNVANGHYPAVFSQDPTCLFTSGIPPKFAKVIVANAPNLGPRSNGYQPGSTGCMQYNATLLAGLRVVDGMDNIQPSADMCCQNCRDTPPCNTWAYCPSPQGCIHYYRNSSWFPPGACRLLYYGPLGMNGAVPMYVGEGTALAKYGHGDLISFISGVPIQVANVSVPSYQLYGFKSLFGMADFDCGVERGNMSWGTHPICRMQVLDEADAAERCSGISGCQVFSYAPNGDGLNDGEGPIAVLKGAGSEMMSILENNATDNPVWSLYVSNALLGLPMVSDQGEDTSPNLGLIIGLSVLGAVALLAAGCVTMAIVVRRMRQAAQRDAGIVPLSVALRQAAKSSARPGWFPCLAPTPWGSGSTTGTNIIKEGVQTSEPIPCNTDWTRVLSHICQNLLPGNLSQDMTASGHSVTPGLEAINANGDTNLDSGVNGDTNFPTNNGLLEPKPMFKSSDDVNGECTNNDLLETKPMYKSSDDVMVNGVDEDGVAAAPVGCTSTSAEVTAADAHAFKPPPISAGSVFSDASESPFRDFFVAEGTARAGAGGGVKATAVLGGAVEGQNGTALCSPSISVDVVSLASGGSLPKVGELRGLPTRPATGSDRSSGSLRGAGMGSLLPDLDTYRKSSTEVGDSYGWEVHPSELQICKGVDNKDLILGKGAFGTVYKATFRRGMYVAVKELVIDRADGRDVSAAILKEISILKSVRSPNIVQFMGACKLLDRFLLVTEFMEGGTLWSALHRKVVTWYQRGNSIALDSAEGLHFLHSRKVLHMDFKSANVLLDRHLRGKVCDVGVAHVLQSSYAYSLTAAGTFAWMAPEVLLGGRVSTKADVYSFGVVLWEIVTGEEPVRGCLRPVSVPEECPEEVSQLIEACLQSEPSQRPAMDSIISSLRALLT